jgi:cyclophilin family peptidyl-prolyl cis-trans isomerase
VSGKSRRDRKSANENSPQAPTNPAPNPAESGAQPRNVFAIVLGLVVLVVGGGFLIFFLTRGANSPSGPKPQVLIETSEGPIKVELFQQNAPITVKNFLAYVDAKFYDGTLFHRVIPGFMIQGGGFLPGMEKKESIFPQIRNEAGNGLANQRGTLAMARTSDPDSASSEFFINLKYNDFLDRANAQDRVGYAVFGQVIEGMDVVDKIAGLPTGLRGSHGDVPVQDVVIKSVRRIETK